MKTLKYSRITKTGKLIEFTYSECDKDLVEKHTWYMHNTRKYIFTYIKSGNKRRNTKLHRLIMNTPDDKVTDHIDGNPLNNTRENLRICEQGQNCMNVGNLKNNTSGYKGVSKTANGKWRAYISLHRKQIHLGNHNDIKDAIKARQEAEEKYFSEFRRK
jgi:hypothetical protein